MYVEVKPGILGNMKLAGWRGEVGPNYGRKLKLSEAILPLGSF